MPLRDSSRAIGATTGLLAERIEQLTSHNVTVGRPEPPSANGGIANPRLNLFLYEAVFDPHLRNTPLDEGQPAPLWLVLRYLITPFDAGGESDTADAYRVLGDGLRALQSVASLPLTGLSPTDQAALDANPQRLRVTFTESPASLLSSLMQHSDEKYRFSMAFEVRPVMIASAAPPAYALLVGVDYSGAAAVARADAGVAVLVEPTLGPTIERVTPAAFAAGDGDVRVEGTELHLAGLEFELGPLVLPLTLDPDGAARFRPTIAALDADLISAGSHALTAARTLANGRRRRSNVAVVDLRPVVTAATLDPGALEVRGRHLGTLADDVVIALLRAGVTAYAYDDVTVGAGNPQTHRRVALSPAPAAGTYRVVVRVNGQQALQAPEVTLP